MWRPRLLKASSKKCVRRRSVLASAYKAQNLCAIVLRLSSTRVSWITHTPQRLSLVMRSRKPICLCNTTQNTHTHTHTHTPTHEKSPVPSVTRVQKASSVLCNVHNIFALRVMAR